MHQLARDDETIGANQGSSRGQDALLAVGGEGDIGDAGVAAAEGPFRLAVADDEYSRCGHVSQWLLLLCAGMLVVSSQRPNIEKKNEFWVEREIRLSLES